MIYRGEIDGLRALAVIPVMLFHAGFELFSGGFVGVDVFFVISGYLITSIILADLRQGRFSIITFYERRARRILPALFVMMALCIPFAWFWLLPGDLRTFAQSVISVPLFASNVLFWRQSGYFDSAAELKPLLHTWSLAVEEQFYVIFPLFLLLVARTGRRWTVWILAAAASASLLLAQFAVSAQPTATFFLLPTRGWELAIGALVAIYLSEPDHHQPTRSLRDILSMVGLALILGSVFAYGKSTPFPSLYALAPTMGTALLILFASGQTRVGRLLASPLLVGIGLVSYSAYLWHQPIFAFLRHKSQGEPEAPVLLGLLLLTFLVAYLSWRFVEQPFRARNLISRRTVFASAGLASVFFVAVGVLGVVTNGAEYRLSKAERDLIALGDYKAAMLPFQLRTCFIDYDQKHEVLMKSGCFAEATSKRRVVIFGDSEAAHLAHGVRSLFPADAYRVDQWTATSCRPASFSDQGDRCSDFYRAFMATVLPRLSERDILLIAGNWGDTERRIGVKEFRQQMSESLGQLARTPATVVVFGNAPDFARPPIDQIVKLKALGQHAVYLQAVAHGGTNERVRELAGKHGLVYFDPVPHLCNGRLQCLVYQNGEPLFSDTNHLSAPGSKLIVDRLIKQLRDGRLV